MCDKAVNRWFFCIYFVFFLFFLYKNQEMCDRIVFEDPFILIYGSDQYNVRWSCWWLSDNVKTYLWLVCYK